LPDFVALAKAFGWGAHRVSDPAELSADSPRASIATALLLDVNVAAEEELFPDDAGWRGSSPRDAGQQPLVQETCSSPVSGHAASPEFGLRGQPAVSSIMADSKRIGPILPGALPLRAA
jgi:hypothetical protein